MSLGMDVLPTSVDAVGMPKSWCLDCWLVVRMPKLVEEGFKAVLGTKGGAAGERCLLMVLPLETCLF